MGAPARGRWSVPRAERQPDIAELPGVRPGTWVARRSGTQHPARSRPARQRNAESSAGSIPGVTITAPKLLEPAQRPHVLSAEAVGLPAPTPCIAIPCEVSRKLANGRAIVGRRVISHEHLPGFEPRGSCLQILLSRVADARRVAYGFFPAAAPSGSFPGAASASLTIVWASSRMRRKWSAPRKLSA